ncbi:MAG: ABC transporter permease [Bacillota bacterium]
MRALTLGGSIIYFGLLLLPLGALVYGGGIGNLARIWQDTPVFNALWLSVKTATIAVVIIMAIGIPTAYFLERKSGSLGRKLSVLVELPVVMPPAVAGLALLSTYGKGGLLGPELDKLGISIPFSTTAVVLAQIFVAAPFFLRTLRTGIASLRQDEEGAARVLGASETSAFFSVVLPTLSTSILAGAAMAWSRAVGEFGATLMFAGNLPGKTQTAPLAIYTLLQEDYGLAAALSIILMVTALIILTLVYHIQPGGRKNAHMLYSPGGAVLSRIRGFFGPARN